MLIFNGKKEADNILSGLKKKIKKEKIKPKLAVISVGKNPASELFIRNKKRAAKKIGIEVLRYKLSKEKEVIQKIKNINSNKSINGIIVQLPLPRTFNTGKIIREINPRKDVDGFRKNTPFLSPLISSILIALRKSTKKLKGKKIFALVNSDIFGKTLKKYLKKENISINYLKNEKNHRIKSADILITVLGAPNLIKEKMLKKGVILIDAGISVIGKNKVIGDIDRKSVQNKASFLSPVPGGIGPLTIALLLKNVYLASKKHE
jgi:methylenetetrahydrofolate dehydrogenase (NADP+)/methenyltetrahydrofolate cyclohydrolase